ncbi:hypothetical protein [Rahnella bonaserana]|uniref:Uncharacterized protein n=1 Tax=Rahnella bonaserana TaxID=2816248 RepID=A0ABS6M011_9GAMM|nr:hypothetical protein [Rahnella bonaserana]MBU9857357.1 hypothetical protein [Rahnella bonaserana]
MNKPELIELSENTDLFLSEMIRMIVNSDEHLELVKMISDTYSSGEISLIDILTKKTANTEGSGFFGRSQLIEKLLPELRLTLEDAILLTEFTHQNRIYLSPKSFSRFEENLCSNYIGVEKSEKIVEWLISSPQESKNLIIPILLSTKESNDEYLISYLIPLLNSKKIEIINQCLVFLDHNQIEKKEVCIKMLEILDDESLNELKELAISALINFVKVNLITTTELIDIIQTNVNEDSDFFANCLFHKRTTIDETLFDYLSNKVKNETILNDENAPILNSIIYNLIDSGSDNKTIEFIETMGLRGKNIEYLSKLSSIEHHIAQNEEIFKKIVIKWFSEGNDKLFPIIDSIHKNINDANNYKFKNRVLETENLTQRQLKYIIIRSSGWFFFHPKLALEFIVLLYEKLDEKNRLTSAHVITDVFLSNYLATIDEYLKLHLESALAKDFQNKIETLKKQANISWMVNELKNSASLTNEFEVNEHKEMEEVYKQAHKNSILSQFATPLHILYGNGSIYYTESINTPPVRQEMTMGTFEHSFERPAMLVTDTTGLELMLIKYKFGELK